MQGWANTKSCYRLPLSKSEIKLIIVEIFTDTLSRIYTLTAACITNFLQVFSLSLLPVAKPARHLVMQSRIKIIISIILFLEIDSLYGLYKHRKIFICMTKCRAGPCHCLLHPPRIFAVIELFFWICPTTCEKCSGPFIIVQFQ